MHSANRTWAWFQGVVLVAGMGVVVALLMLAAYRPFDENTLAVLTGQLRSDVREGRELLRLYAQQQAAYATFTQQHARELDKHVADLAKSLRNKPAVAALEPVRVEAESAARELDGMLAAIAADPALAGAKRAELARLCDRIELAHRRAKPGA